MDTLPQGLASLPNELVLLIFEFILKITDKRQFLKTCKKYNLMTKQSFHHYEKNYEIENFDKIEKYCVEKFTLELCYDKYFEMVPERYIIASNNILIKSLILFDCLSLLELARKNGCNLYNVYGLAAFHGNLEILKWAKDKGFEFNSRYVVHVIQNGHLEVLKWMHDNYYINQLLRENMCNYAASSGQLDILKWTHENGYKWDASTCSNAALSGNVECLKYLRLNKCEWNKYVHQNANNYGHKELLEWAMENGCPI